jgi:hypothetical protein
MMPLQKHFLQRITSLRGLLVSAATPWLNIALRVSLHRNLRCHNLAVILHTISALALRAPRAAFTINAFAKASV